MKKEIAIIGSQTLGTATEIYEIMHGDNKASIVVIAGEDKTKSFAITRMAEIPELFIPLLTRAERRKLKRKSK